MTSQVTQQARVGCSPTLTMDEQGLGKPRPLVCPSGSQQTLHTDSPGRVRHPCELGVRRGASWPTCKLSSWGVPSSGCSEGRELLQVILSHGMWDPVSPQGPRPCSQQLRPHTSLSLARARLERRGRGECVGTPWETGAEWVSLLPGATTWSFWGTLEKPQGWLPGLLGKTRRALLPGVSCLAQKRWNQLLPDIFSGSPLSLGKGPHLHPEDKRHHLGLGPAIPSLLSIQQLPPAAGPLHLLCPQPDTFSSLCLPPATQKPLELKQYLPWEALPGPKVIRSRRQTQQSTSASLLSSHHSSEFHALVTSGFSPP